MRAKTEDDLNLNLHLNAIPTILHVIKELVPLNDFLTAFWL